MLIKQRTENLRRLTPAHAALLPLLLLATCDGPAIVTKSESGPSVSIERQLGSWTMIHYTMAFDAENVAGGMAEMVKAGQASVGKKDFGGPLCLDAALVAKDDLSTRLNEAIRLGPEFRVIRSAIRNGQVDFAAVSEDRENGTSTITISGLLTPTTSDLVVTTEAWQPAPGKGHIRTVMKQENSRVGDCSVGQDPWQ